MAYFCHKCRQQCQVDQQMQCTRCHEGFIEELDEMPARMNQPGSGQAETPPILSTELTDNPFGMFPQSPFSRLFAHIPRQQQNEHQQPHRRFSFDERGTTSNNGGNSNRNMDTGHANVPENAEEGDPQDAFQHILQNFISNLVHISQADNTGNQGGPIHFAIQISSEPGHSGEGSGGAGMFRMHGNMADYAWGPNGLDNILTHLLNQFDQAQEQARALSSEDIQRLPMTKVTQKYVDNGTQCSTCMEVFQLNEQVAKLDCEHIFHRPCIEPWLKRNNTCPICRKQIDPKKWHPKITDIDELD